MQFINNTFNWTSSNLKVDCYLQWVSISTRTFRPVVLSGNGLDSLSSSTKSHDLNKTYYVYLTEILHPNVRSQYMPLFDVMVGVTGCVLAIFALVSDSWIQYTICMASLMTISTGLIYFMQESNKWLQAQEIQTNTNYDTNKTARDFFSSWKLIKMTLILG